MSENLSVAIIGAGASGLAACHHLKDKFKVVVYEEKNNLGGVWNYHERNRNSALFDELRSNLPKELMGYFGFEFTEEYCTSYDNQKSFISFESTQHYLEAYAKMFKLEQYIRYDTKVVKVEYSTTNNKDSWILKIQDYGSQTFDAVVICNGHYNSYYIPDFLSQENILKCNWKAQVAHSQFYNSPSQIELLNGESIALKDKRVAVLGMKPSGMDISKSLFQYGVKELHICEASSDKSVIHDFNKLKAKVCASDAVYLHNRIENIKPNSKCLVTCNKEVFEVDVVICATGYDYCYDFIALHGLLDDTKRRVRELTRQIQHQRYKSLFFVGLPSLIIPFPLFTLQALWVRYTLENVRKPISEDEFDADKQLIRFHGGHSMKRSKDIDYEHNHRKQFRYWDVLLEDMGLSSLWQKNRVYREKIYGKVTETRPIFPIEGDGYRNVLYRFEPESMSSMEELQDLLK